MENHCLGFLASGSTLADFLDAEEALSPRFSLAGFFYFLLSLLLFDCLRVSRLGYASSSEEVEAALLLDLARFLKALSLVTTSRLMMGAAAGLTLLVTFRSSSTDSLKLAALSFRASRLSC
jgi:hypothetical protein